MGMRTHTRISQHSRPEFWELVNHEQLLLRADWVLKARNSRNSADLPNLQISLWNFSLVVKILNLRIQQVVLKWLHYKFPIWSRKVFLSEHVTHCKEIHYQSVNSDREHPQRALGPGRRTRLGGGRELFSWLCHLLLVWLWPWGCLPGLIFSDMDTFIIQDSEPMYTWNFV